MRENPGTDVSGGENGGVPLGFGGLYASVGDHIGHFYQTGEERTNLVVSFLRAGLEAGEKCMYFMNPGPREELEDGLADAGIPVKAVMDSGELIVDEGADNPEAMQDTLGSALAEIPGRFPLLRWGGDMTWALGKLPTTEMLMEWETHCNVIENPRAVFLCQYDLTAFRGNVVMDALKTHPLCVVSNAIHQNPYYEKPQAFLEELRRRAPTALAS